MKTYLTAAVQTAKLSSYGQICSLVARKHAIIEQLLLGGMYAKNIASIRHALRAFREHATRARVDGGVLLDVCSFAYEHTSIHRILVSGRCACAYSPKTFKKMARWGDEKPCFSGFIIRESLMSLEHTKVFRTIFLLYKNK